MVSLKIAKSGCRVGISSRHVSVSGVPQGDLLCAILFNYRKLYMLIGKFSNKNVLKCIL